jgi:hypothetical protein
MANKNIRIIVFFVFISTYCFSQSTVCAYKYRKRITFDPTKVSGPIDLANFTALINITSDNDLRTVANSGHVESASGFDIIFTSDDGVTKLDHQLEQYTATTGAFVGWVRIPVLSTSINTYIYMYYGNTAIVADQSVNTTWSSGYAGVWHLNNNVFTDGTSNGNNATNNGSTNMAAAKIAGGRSFPGAGTDYVQLPLSGASGGSGNGSVEMWGMVTTISASKYFFGETTTQNGSYANRLQIYVGDASGNLYLGIGGNHSIQTNVQLLSANTWYHIAVTWATSGSGVGTYSIFVNGAQKGSNSYSGFTSIYTFADIGNDGNAGQRTEEITGNMDEVHVTNTTLSADWVLTEYNNQNSPSTFYAISVEPKVWTGGTNTNYNSASNWLNNSAASSGNDVIINNGANQPTLQGNEQVNSIFIRTGAVLSLGANNLSVQSDISNCGTITGNTGMVTLNSTSAFSQNQNLSGSGTYNLNNLTVNNTFATSPSVTLNKDVNVSGGLTLTSGIVYTSATNILALATGATSTSGSASSFVSGPISKVGSTDFVFPTGKGTSWRRTSVTNITASSTFRAEYFNTPYTSTSPVNSPLTNVSLEEYWQVDRIVGTGNANLSLYWENATASGINNCANLTIGRWNGSSWDERPGTTTGGSSCAGAGTGVVLTNAALTAFSPFTFGSRSSGVNPLPIELLGFYATCDPKQVVLSWSTATESNNDHFVLERSTNGIDWTDISHIKGAGTSTSKKTYAYNDTSYINNISYYRLSQVDLDNKKEMLKILSINCVPKNEEMKLYPNPATNELSVEFDLSQNYGEGLIRLMDNLGRVNLQQKVDLVKGINIYRLPLHLSQGLYSILFSSEHLILPVQKLIIK